MSRLKRAWKWIVGVVITVMCLLLVACNSKFDELQNIPPTVFSGGLVLKRDLAYHFGKQAGFNSVKIQIPTTAKILLVDGKFKAVDYYWFIKFNNWFRDLLHGNGIMALGEQTENLDCDNFAMMYKALMSVAAYKSGDQYEPATSLLVLRADKEFGGIPGTGGLHMNVLVMTNRGWYVVEPQTGKFTLLENYPNQHTVGILLM